MKKSYTEEKSDMESVNDKDLSASSSNQSDIPIAYTGRPRNDDREEAHKSFETIRKTFRLSGENNENDDGYSCKEIYGELDNDEIKLQRNQTRNTIISELASRNNQHEDSPDSNEEICKLDDGGLAIDNNGEEFEAIDPELITFEGFDDREDPRNFSNGRKVYIVLFASIYTLVAPISSSIISPALTDISKEFGIKNQVILAMIVSIQILAWACGPLVIAPLSEDDTFGRKTILDVSCWASFFFNIGCAFSKNTQQLLIFRFLSGLFSSTPLNVAPAVVGDLFPPKSRNVSLAGLFLLPLLGPVIAPLIGEFIVINLNWRWTLYILCITNGVVAILGTFLYQETYAPTILMKKARKLRKLTGNHNLHTIYEISNGESRLTKMKMTVILPLILLFTHPIVIGLGGFMAFIYGLMYLMIVTFPSIYGKHYGFSKGAVGLMYLPMGIGFIIGVIFWTIILQKIYIYLSNKNGGIGKPEYRIPCLLINTGLLIPISLLWYGWLIEYKLHWIMPSIGTAIFGFSFCCVFQSLQGVLIDSIKFSASALAASAVFRSICGFTYPLFANTMYSKMGYGMANTMFAIIAIVIGVPFPIILFKYGESIRESANKRLQKYQDERDAKILAKLLSK